MDERQPGAAAFVAQNIARVDTVDVHLHAGSFKGNAVEGLGAALVVPVINGDAW
jgi:hypothetical protein